MAAALFVVMAVVMGLIGWVIVVSSPGPRIFVALPLLGVPLGIALLLTLAVGLTRRMPWAEPPAVALTLWQ
mgnify:CR=1 FL=1